MDANWRREAIVEILRQRGKVRAKELAERFQVTRQTIYHDVEVMGAGRVRALLGFVQQREHALGGGKGGVDLIENVGDLVDRGGEFPGVEDEG